MPEPQNFKNHGRFVPMFHVGVLFPLLYNVLWTAYKLRAGITLDGLVSLAVAVALLLLALSVRTQILTVQDRVIRNEMRQRLGALLPADLYAAADALPIKQVVALRFAGDAELPALVREVVAGKVTTTKDIKMRVKDWQADYLRA